MESVRDGARRIGDKRPYHTFRFRRLRKRHAYVIGTGAAKL
jgi:hypothetical protein